MTAVTHVHSTRGWGWDKITVSPCSSLSFHPTSQPEEGYLGGEPHTYPLGSSPAGSPWGLEGQVAAGRVFRMLGGHSCIHSAHLLGLPFHIPFPFVGRPLCPLPQDQKPHCAAFLLNEALRASCLPFMKCFSVSPPGIWGPLSRVNLGRKPRGCRVPLASSLEQAKQVTSHVQPRPQPSHTGDAEFKGRHE